MALAREQPGVDWRGLLSAVRRAGIRLAIAGRIDILRKGKPVDPNGVKGVIRLRIRAASPEVNETDGNKTGAGHELPAGVSETP